MAADADTVLARCDALAAFTEEDGKITRRFATPALRAAGDAVEEWMRAAGMTTRRDAIGNVIGRLEGEGPGTLLLGSHLDSIRDAGRYDGPLGIVVAIACAERHPTPPCTLEIYAFADEEGVRYGTAYLGSGVVAGQLDLAVLQRRDADGIAMADAIADFGGDPDALAGARREASDLLGYVEVHIEQGPVLEDRDVPLGVVTAIIGQTRATVTFTGRAGHAGTVPMDLRHDALAGAAELILAVEDVGRHQDGLVATVGEASVEPGASNVVPGRAVLSLDVRHADDATRAAAHERLRLRAQAIAEARGLGLDWDVLQETAAVVCDPALTAALGDDLVHLTSGAGHDAAVMAAIAPVAMLFVRCAGGISHHPDESVTAADVDAAIDALDRFLNRVVGEPRSG